MHLDGLDAFDAIHHPTTGGYRGVIMQLSDTEVGLVDQVTGDTSDSWVPKVTGLELSLAIKAHSTKLPDPF